MWWKDDDHLYQQSAGMFELRVLLHVDPQDVVVFETNTSFNTTANISMLAQVSFDLFHTFLDYLIT